MRYLTTFFGILATLILLFAGTAAAQKNTQNSVQNIAQNNARNQAQMRTISIDARTIKDAFAQIERQTGMIVAYENTGLDTGKHINLKINDLQLENAMAEILRNTGMTHKTTGRHIIIVPVKTEKPAPKNHTISGRVTDRATGEAMIGCAVFEPTQNRGATTNAYGFYSLTLPAGAATIISNTLGYSTFQQQMDLQKDLTLDIALDATATAIEEVVVEARGADNPLTQAVGAVSVPVARIKNAPVLLGESDMMKSLQYIPGVQGGTEGRADLSVRGGGPDQNLVLLDGNPIYNANHLFGFVSVFNTDALKNVTLYKSGFPARFGGRLSSVVDVNTRDGDKERFGGSATLGLLAAKFNVEGPIVKRKTSFTLSGRRSWADAFMGALQEEDYKTTMFFYDLNAKIHHRLTGRTSIYLTAYNGRDRLKSTSIDNYGSISETFEQRWGWGNTIVAARLNSALTGNLFLNANLSLNRYRFDTYVAESSVVTEQSGNQQKTFSSIDYRSGIRDYTASAEIEYIPSTAHYIRAGVQGVVHDFRPEALSMRGENNAEVAGDKIRAGEAAIYIEDEWNVARRLTLGGGLRASVFRVQGRTYAGLDPRLSAVFRVTEKAAIKASYARMQQYIHLLSSNSLLYQTDLWMPATGRIRPMNSTQYSIGASLALPRNFNFSVETYYKDMRGVIEYKDGASFSGESAGWENKVEAGTGRAYGVELSIERKIGRTTGSISYAWSKSERKFEEINFGRWFPAKHDRRHAVNITVTHRLNKKIDLSASWTYHSGELRTVPTMGLGGYMASTGPDQESQLTWSHITLLDGRNNFRMPAYHRLDVGMNFHPRRWRSPRRYGEWRFGAYNLYNRMNAFTIYVDTGNPTNGNQAKLKKTVMFPLLPSVSYTYNF